MLTKREQLLTHLLLDMEPGAEIPAPPAASPAGGTVPRVRGVRQAMEYIREKDPGTSLTETALRRLMKSGAVPTITVGRRMFVVLDALEEYLSAPPAESAKAAKRGELRKINYR